MPVSRQTLLPRPLTDAAAQLDRDKAQELWRLGCILLGMRRDAGYDRVTAGAPGGPRRRTWAEAGVLLTVVVAVGFTLWYRTTYNVWPGQGASSRVHWCGRDYQDAGPPLTRLQAEAQAQFSSLRAEGSYPPLALSPDALLAATYPADQQPVAICGTLVFLRTGPDSYKPYSLEGGF